MFFFRIEDASFYAESSAVTINIFTPYSLFSSGKTLKIRNAMYCLRVATDVNLLSLQE